MAPTVLPAVLAVIAVAAAAPVAARPATDPLAAATQALCSRRVALLGENAVHGSGATLAFKAALAGRLIERCGYDTILFEASRTEAMAFQRAARAGSADRTMLAAAVGGLWARYREFAPLGDLLVARANVGRVFVGGLDDALGVRGATYTNGAMIEDLAAPLGADDGARCIRAFRARLFWDLSSPAFGPPERALLDACLDRLQAASDASAEQVAMIAAVRRALARDLLAPHARYAARERDLYASFLEIAGRRPRGSKFIVWGATAHLARDSTSWPSLAGAPSLGSLIHRRYGRGAFTLGFSALTGNWRRSTEGQHTPWSLAPAYAIESRALGAGTDTAFVDRAQLRRWGEAPGRLWNEAFVTTRWDRAVDALVVFRVDRPPTPGD